MRRDCSAEEVRRVCGVAQEEVGGEVVEVDFCGMATVMSGRVEMPERSPSFNSRRRVQSKSPVMRSPKSVLLPESLDSTSESSSLASSILGEQIVECSSFRKGAKVKESCVKAVAEANFEQVDDYTW